MPRPCSICTHEKRGEIEARLLNNDPRPVVAQMYGLSVSAIFRHKANCRVTALAGVVPGKSRVDVMANLEILHSDAVRIQQAAEEDRSHIAAVSAIGRRKDLIMAMHEVQGVHAESVDVTKHPDFLRLLQRIIQALEPHPEARVAVQRALTAPTPGGDSGNPE